MSSAPGLLSRMASVFARPKPEVAGKPVVLVVGGGYAGVTVAKLLDKEGSFNVILIDRKDYFLHNLASTRAVVEEGFEKEILIPYSNLLQLGNVVQGEVTQIRHKEVLVAGFDQGLQFDYLIIATGSSYAFPLKTRDASVKQAGVHYEKVQKAIAKAKKIAIIGGGLVGVELAGEIAAANSSSSKKITLIHSGNTLADIGNAAFSKRVERKLDELKVTVIKGERAEFPEGRLKRLKDAMEKEGDDVAVARLDSTIRIERGIEELEVKERRAKKERDQDAAKKYAGEIRQLRKGIPVEPLHYDVVKTTLRTDKDTEVPVDLILFCTGTSPSGGPEVLKAFSSTKTGRLEVDQFLRVKGHENIYAIGDIADVEPQMTYYADFQARYLAEALAYQHKTNKPPKKYEVHTKFGAVVSMGKKAGVALLPTLGVYGSRTSTRIKSADMYTNDIWLLLGQDRKSKTPKTGASNAAGLAAALDISEEAAQKIIEESLAADLASLNIKKKKGKSRKEKENENSDDDRRNRNKEEKKSRRKGEEEEERKSRRKDPEEKTRKPRKNSGSDEEDGSKRSKQKEDRDRSRREERPEKSARSEPESRSDRSRRKEPVEEGRSRRSDKGRDQREERDEDEKEQRVSMRLQREEDTRGKSRSQRNEEDEVGQGRLNLDHLRGNKDKAAVETEDEVEENEGDEDEGDEGDEGDETDMESSVEEEEETKPDGRGRGRNRDASREPVQERMSSRVRASRPTSPSASRAGREASREPGMRRDESREPSRQSRRDAREESREPPRAARSKTLVSDDREPRSREEPDTRSRANTEDRSERVERRGRGSPSTSRAGREPSREPGRREVEREPRAREAERESRGRESLLRDQSELEPRSGGSRRRSLSRSGGASREPSRDPGDRGRRESVSERSDSRRSDRDKPREDRDKARDGRRRDEDSDRRGDRDRGSDGNRRR